MIALALVAAGGRAKERAFNLTAEQNNMAGASFRSSFDLLPAEVLDMIVEKVRSDSGESFQALGGTSRAFLASARRCTRTLVVAPLKEVEKRTVALEASHRDSSLSVHLNEVLLEEIRKRPSLSELVMNEPGNPHWGGGFSIVTALLGVRWTKCTMLGHACASGPSHLTAWDGSFCKRVLSGSEESLEKLSLRSFQLEESTLLELGQLFPNLEALKVGGSVGECDLPKHDKLSQLDVSGLQWFKKCPTVGISTSVRPNFRGFIATSVLRGVWPPNVSQLIVAGCCEEEPACSKISILHPLGSPPSLPCTLVVLEVNWQMCDKTRGLLFQVSGGRPVPQYWPNLIAHCFVRFRCEPLQM